MINRFLLGMGAFLLCIVVVFHAYAADSLCPDLDTSKKTDLGDVAGVQADIERLNLCVERAKLLKQLDDIAQQRSDTLNKVTNPGMGNMGTGLGMGLPLLPMSSLPSLPQQAETKSGNVKIKNAAANPLDAAPTPVAGPAVWKVRKIWGQAGGVSGAVMRAQISDGKGALLNVVKGDPLPDGKVIESVSVRGVTISQNGKISDLSWDSAQDGSEPSDALKPGGNTDAPNL